MFLLLQEQHFTAATCDSLPPFHLNDEVVYYNYIYGQETMTNVALAQQRRQHLLHIMSSKTQHTHNKKDTMSI